MKGRGIAHLFSVLTSLILAAVSEDYRKLSPAGLKICERLCHRTAGCHRFRYSSRHLSCRLLAGYSKEWGSDATAKVYSIEKNINQLYNLRGDKCTSTSLIFQRKKNDSICLIRTIQGDALGNVVFHPGSPNNHHELGYTLLIVKSEEGDIKQLALRDNSVSQYLDKFDGADDMAYVPMSKKLVFKNCNLLFIASVNLSDVKVIKRNVKGGIGVAEDRVFFFTRPGYTSDVNYFSMSPYGTNVTKLTSTRWVPKSFAVDINRRHLYISSNTIINIYNYVGLVLGSFKGCRKLFIEPYSDWMYSYALEEDEVYRMSLVTNTSTLFAVIPNPDDTGEVCIFDDIIYFVDFDCNVMVIWKFGRKLVKTFEKGNPVCRCCLVT